MQDNAPQNNPLNNNPFAFWAGLVLFFLGLIALFFYLFVRTAQESLIMPGPQLRIKHLVLAVVIMAAGAVVASFARPRSDISQPTG